MTPVLPRLLVILLVGSLCTELQAGENPLGRTRTGDVGDGLQVAIPLTALVTSWVKGDDQGTRQFATGFAVTLATSYGLKSVISKERPDGRDDESFPSSHTAVSFHAAGYLHERYGWKWGLPAYIAARFVGYSRVHDDRHDEQDVIAGAALGWVAARWFTTELGGVQVTPQVGEDFVGVSVYKRF